MFQVPAFASARLYIQRGMTGRLTQPGFPIRKSTDQCLFAGFPWLIAGYSVLRRLSMPRHPPCTLSSLTTIIDRRLEHTHGAGFRAEPGVRPHLAGLAPDSMKPIDQQLGLSS